jgi:hypothetical protein
MGILQSLFKCWNKDVNKLNSLLYIKILEEKVEEQKTVIKELDIDIKELEFILKAQNEYLNVSTTVE